MSDKIKRSQVDDINRRNNAADSYKNRSFGNKKSITDEYTGKRIFYNANKHINEKQSNVDHIVPLDEQIRRYGSDLTPEQIRTMANADANLANTNASLNKSKGALNNHEYIAKKYTEAGAAQINDVSETLFGKKIFKTNKKAVDCPDAVTSVNMLKEEVKAEAHIRTQATKYKIENTVNEIKNSKVISSKLDAVAPSVKKATAAGREAAFVTATVDLLISRIPKGEQRITFILDKGLEPVINDVGAKKDYFVLKALIKKDLLAVQDNKIVWYAKQIDELIKTLQELDLWEEPSLEEVRKKLNDDYADDLKKELLARDKVRFDLTEYNDMLLEDPNGGSWELWEAEIKQEKTVQTECSFYARDPRMDIVDGGVVGIDFGTKSTVVVTQDDSDAIEPVRIGKGDVVKEPSVKDYENPTVMQFIDIDSFMKDYQKYPGRPLTRYADATASHTAYNAWNENKESRDYFSYFAELKQWAGDSERRVRIRDIKGKEINLPPYEELQEGDFDPIELYAYYIGLHINNQYSKRIYMEYLLSFPVTYALDVRNRILNSFRKGLRRSLPQTVLQDAQCMEKFRVEQGVGEPAAYAVCALQEFKLFPKENEKIAYAIFDFGGGTTDFDFGIWRKASGVKERRYHYVIEHFGDGGDKYLGGENLLELLAFNVFCKNKQLLRTKKITFVKPPECERFIGYEGLLSDSQEAYSNMRQLMEKLRGFWEGKVPEGKLQKAAGSGQGQAAGSEAQWFSDGKVKVDLFTASGKQESVDLTVDAAELQKILQARIEQGVDSFFDALLVNINKDEYYEVIKNCDKINIFLAGNSSKSKILQEVFKKKISDFTNKLKQGAKEKQSKISFDKAFMLHQPLGAESKDKENAAACLKRPTGKTGVAIGLVQCRPGSVIKVISEKKTQEEIKFRLFIGHSDENGYFEADLTRDSKYNEWQAYFDAGEDRFEFYYTTSTSAGRKRGLLVKDSKKSRQQLPKNAVNEDWLIYLRPVAPNKIQYVVAEDDEALKNGKFKFEPVTVELNY